MDVFETPSWEGDCGTDKLTDELFCSHNVPVAKVTKKRKRNKHVKVSVTVAECSKNSDLQNEKKKITDEKKNRKCNGDKIQCPHVQRSISMGRGKSKEVSRQAKDGNSALSQNSPKQKKKKKKSKNIAEEGEIKNMKSAHNLKNLKSKLDLNLKVKLCGKGSSKGISTPTDNHGQQKPANALLQKQKHDSPIHTIKNSQKKNLVSGRNNGAIFSHLKEKKSENVAKPKKKIKTKATDPNNLPEHVVYNKRKQSLTPGSLDSNAESLFQEKILSDGINTKKKDAGDTRKNVGAFTVGVSSHSSGMTSATLRGKRKHPENSVIGERRVKKLRKGGDTQLDVEDLSKETPSPSANVVLHQARGTDDGDEMDNSGHSPNHGTMTSPKKKLTLREKMMEKLRGSRFRFLNEQMYSSKSEETRKYFQMDPQSFKAYHEGYNQQLSQWPVKPVDMVIKHLKKKPANYIIADFGCGDAQIAKSLPNQVHSFDHVALNDLVTICDMAHTPLSNGTVDVAVFCLSLMGCNLSDYIYEANRVLKIGGILKIAEVESRFDGVENFIKVICKFGFLCISQDLSKDVFYLFDFKKEKNLKEGISLPRIELRACSYKKR